MTIDTTTNGAAQSSHGQGNNAGEENFAIKAGLAQMLKGGVIMDVVNAEQVRLPVCHSASIAHHPSLTENGH